MTAEHLLKMYREVLSHLNSEEDELALEFRDELVKYMERVR